jgi:hypothetical protein
VDEVTVGVGVLVRGGAVVGAPADTMTVTVDDGATWLPLGGSVPITFPAATDVLFWVVRLTWKPKARSSAAAVLKSRPRTSGTPTVTGAVGGGVVTAAVVCGGAVEATAWEVAAGVVGAGVPVSWLRTTSQIPNARIANNTSTSSVIRAGASHRRSRDVSSASQPPPPTAGWSHSPLGSSGSGGRTWARADQTGGGCGAGGTAGITLVPDGPWSGGFTTAVSSPAAGDGWASVRSG